MLVLATSFSLFGTAVFAQATPNHVYQKTEAIYLLVDELHTANFSEASNNRPFVDAAMPRHVLQMVSDVWRKTQLLRFINGLPTHSLEPLPARAITPQDVIVRVNQVLEQIHGLMPAYGVSTEPAVPALPTNKTPKDVYANLARLSVSLDQLGIPATVPNDVYQVAQTVLVDTIALARISGITSTQSALDSVPNITGKIPRDAYFSALELLEDLSRIFSSNDAYSITGGVTVPSKEPSQFTPAEVMFLLYRARADINAMRVGVGDRNSSAEASYEGGKTPSDVVYRIMQAQAVLSMIADR